LERLKKQKEENMEQYADAFNPSVGGNDKETQEETDD
jgi:hypothetical protein